MSERVRRTGTRVVREPPEELEQRQVALEHRLPEPLLLQVVLVVRVADEGEVRMEHEHQRPPRLRHRLA